MNFSEFANRLYPDFSTKTFHENYYRLLEAFAAGRIKRLMITMPPQHGKSHGASILLPAYILGLDPDRHVAMASYSAALAARFNRQAQRVIERPEYAEMFPATTIKSASNRSNNYIRTAEHVEIIDFRGELFSVGREGPLTGNRVDTFILDDLYRDAMEANSPVIRENCWDWYTSVVRTRMHNNSQELIVFTRWHEEDLIGQISQRERVIELTDWSQIDTCPRGAWLHLNLEALKTGDKTDFDRRNPGEPLWPEMHDREQLLTDRNLDALRFECMFQGHPSPAEGLLYGDCFETYDELPSDITARKAYVDTADEGRDYLAAASYYVGKDNCYYVTDWVYSPEPMEVTETLVAEMLTRNEIRLAWVESNNGGRGFARAVEKLLPARTHTDVKWFHQSANKEARILTNASTVMRRIRMPSDWCQRWPELHHHLVTYRRLYRANRLHDAADVLTGIIEKEFHGHRFFKKFRNWG